MENCHHPLDVDPSIYNEHIFYGITLYKRLFFFVKKNTTNDTPLEMGPGCKSSC